MRRAGLVCSMLAMILASLPTPAAHAQGGPNFTRFVAVGDSLTAGFRDGALHEAAQQQVFVKLLADSMGTQIVLPLMKEPGIPVHNPADQRNDPVQLPRRIADHRIELPARAGVRRKIASHPDASVTVG